MKKIALLFLLVTSSPCLGVKLELSGKKLFIAAKPAFQRMVDILKSAGINLKQNDFFYGYKIRMDSLTGIGSLYVAVKSQALFYAIFDEKITLQNLHKTIFKNKVISEVEVPFEQAQAIIEQKWGHLLKQKETE